VEKVTLICEFVDNGNVLEEGKTISEVLGFCPIIKSISKYPDNTAIWKFRSKISD